MRTQTARYEPEDWLTAKDAADVMGVGLATVYGWVKRKRLVVKAHDADGRQLFQFIDVLRAEQKTRRNALGQNRVA